MLKLRGETKLKESKMRQMILQVCQVTMLVALTAFAIAMMHLIVKEWVDLFDKGDKKSYSEHLKEWEKQHELRR
jgi:uncharacterized membrane protein YqhA